MSAVQTFLGALIAFLLGAALAHNIMIDYWRDEAVKHGAAVYYLDEHNERQWRWKETNGH